MHRRLHAGMMCIAHYPQAPALLDFADAHGMLKIAEAGNWNFSACPPGLHKSVAHQPAGE